MSLEFVPTDPYDARIAQRAGGRLAELNAAGVLTAADIHAARWMAYLAGETHPDVLLATALTVKALRNGSVCLDPATAAELLAGDPEQDAPDWVADLPPTSDWLASVRDSALAAHGVLRVEYDRIYLDRYHRQERQVADLLRERIARPGPPVDEAALTASLDRLYPADQPEYADQRAACAHAVCASTTVLTGGPGTGKTTTIARMLLSMDEQARLRDPAARPLRVALAAPTGRAAARMAEAIGSAIAAAGEQLAVPDATTLHRLLGYRHDNRARFRHDAADRLPHDVVILDETSMVSLTQMARLLEALRPESQVVLVGDPDQLASVEAGAVLADLVEGLGEGPGSPVIRLTRDHRFGAEIGALATAIRAGDGERVLDLLRAGGEAVEFHELPEDHDLPRLESVLAPLVLPGAEAMVAAARVGDVLSATAELDRHRFLCAHRTGAYGVAQWNRTLERWLGGGARGGAWYPGRPVMVTANSPTQHLYNGDSGVTVAHGEALRVHVTTATAVRDFAPSRLGETETMHALTIHKSQGSQADVVTVLLPEPGSRLLTRELFYTAVTRAKQRVRVVGTASGVRDAVAQRALRASGLRHRLAPDPVDPAAPADSKEPTGRTVPMRSMPGQEGRA